MNCRAFSSIRPVYVLLLMGFTATQALAASDNATSFAALEAFQAQTTTPISIDGALVVHDLRHWTQSWDYRRTQLEAFELGRQFYEAEDALGGAFFHRELAAILKLANPELPAVPAAIIVFADRTRIPQFQALLQVGTGWRERWETVKDSHVFKDLGMKVDDKGIRIERLNFYAVGFVDEDGWLRLSPSPNSLQGGLHSGPLFSPKMDSWMEGAEGTVFVRRGMMFQTLVLPFISNDQVAGLLEGFQGVAITWETASDPSSRYKFLLDVDGLEGMQPLLKNHPLSNPFVQIWDQDATDFAALSLPPPLLDAIRGMAVQYLSQGGEAEIGLIRKSLRQLTGRAGLVHFGSPKDWAFGLLFNSSAGASEFIQGVFDYGKANLEKNGKDPTKKLLLEVEDTSGNRTLLIRPNQHIEGVRLASLGKSVLFVPQKSRLEKLRRSQLNAAQATEIYQSILNGPILPRVREVIERPALLTGYTVLSAPGMIWDIGKWAFSGLDLFAEEIAKEFNFDSWRSLVQSNQDIASQLALAELILLLTYDCGFTVDVDGSVFVAQLVVSDI